jgi:anaerobic ribonucleoside-triphosphate reductase
MVERKIPCEIYSRVVGFYRPLKEWNPGKKQEFKDRKEHTQGELLRNCDYD